MPNLFQRLRQFPPCLCRVLARDVLGQPLASRQIADGSGLCRTHVDRISALTSWSTVPLGTIEKYLYGCRINPSQWRRHVEFAKRLRNATRPNIARSRNAYYFRRLNQVVGAKAKAKQEAESPAQKGRHAND